MFSIDGLSFSSESSVVRDFTSFVSVSLDSATSSFFFGSSSIFGDSCSRLDEGDSAFGTVVVFRLGSTASACMDKALCRCGLEGSAGGTFFSISPFKLSFFFLVFLLSFTRLVVCKEDVGW